MNERTLISDLQSHIGKEVAFAGWVNVRRDHGKLIFLDIRDRSGVVQCVAQPKHEGAHKEAERLRQEWVVSAKGIVNKRPEKMVNPDMETGDIEIELTEVEVLAESAELPFDAEAELNLDTYLGSLPLTLRTQKGRDIFEVQETIVRAFRESMKERNFTEYQSPAIVGRDAEGGAAAFKVDYYDNDAYLATSPQLYKQIMVGVFERTFTVARVFRGEKHATTRHVSEYTSLDFEFGFIKDYTDVMSMAEAVHRGIAETVASKHADTLARFGVEAPLASEKFPVLKLRDAQEILEREFDTKAVGEPDLEPEHERQICEWARREHGSDYIFITHYPVEKRPFYTYEDEQDPGYTKSFDLLFRGLEITTGGQRIHDYEKLVDKIKEKGLEPEKFAFYLQAFKYGMPPHGGTGNGLERITQLMLGLKNVKQATLFPRDMNRIDMLLSDSE